MIVCCRLSDKSLMLDLPLDHTPAALVQLNRLKQGLEVTFTETLVAFPLNDLEEQLAQVTTTFTQREQVLEDRDALIRNL